MVWADSRTWYIMAKIYLKKHLNALHPADEEATEYLKKIKPGQAISCEVKKPRNYENHKRLFSLLKLVVENQERFKTVDQLKEAIKFELGYTETIQTFDGRFIVKAKSINFASMDEIKFRDFFSRSIDVILKYVLPGTDREELINEVLGYG